MGSDSSKKRRYVCPRKHPLNFGSVMAGYPTGLYECGLCHTSYACNTGRYLCATCHFDICNPCVSRLQSLDPRMYCMYGHQLACSTNQIGYSQGMFHCSLCGRSGPCSNGRWHCESCSYDVCGYCRRPGIVGQRPNVMQQPILVPARAPAPRPVAISVGVPAPVLVAAPAPAPGYPYGLPPPQPRPLYQPQPPPQYQPQPRPIYQPQPPPQYQPQPPPQYQPQPLPQYQPQPPPQYQPQPSPDETTAPPRYDGQSPAVYPTLQQYESRPYMEPTSAPYQAAAHGLEQPSPQYEPHAGGPYGAADMQPHPAPEQAPVQPSPPPTSTSTPTPPPASMPAPTAAPVQDTPQITACPNGHQLSFSMSDTGYMNGVYNCNMCGAINGCSSGRFSCMACKYDLCRNCKSA